MQQILQKNTFSFLLLALCLLLSSCGSSKPIVHGLDERGANEVLVYLDNKGVKAHKVQNTGGGTGQTEVLWDIIVDPENENQAMALLNAAGLPRRNAQNLLKIFENQGLVPSEMQEKIRYEAGLAATIASTIRKIDGVLDADIQLSFPEEDPLNPEKKKGEPTASVYVKHTGVLDDPNTQLITRIRRLVASAVQGMSFDNVTVIPDRARFADLSLRTTSQANKSDKEWVRLWTMTIAKESKTRFQIIFFTFLVLLFLMIGSLIWFLYKIVPLMPEGATAKEFFSLRPLAEKKEPEVEEKDEDDDEDEDDEDEDEHIAPSEEADLEDIEPPENEKE